MEIWSPSFLTWWSRLQDWPKQHWHNVIELNLIRKGNFRVVKVQSVDGEKIQRLQNHQWDGRHLYHRCLAISEPDGVTDSSERRQLCLFLLCQPGKRGDQLAGDPCGRAVPLWLTWGLLGLGQQLQSEEMAVALLLCQAGLAKFYTCTSGEYFSDFWCFCWEIHGISVW